jgi:hypothetical protein
MKTGLALNFGGGAPYDLVVDVGQQLLTGQVKTGRLRKGCINYWTLNNSGLGQHKKRSYTHGEVDLFAVYCLDKEMIYVVPAHSMAQGNLRLFKPINNQQQKI